MSLLAVTNQICQDVAVVPFLWILPLSLYLITFIICFDAERWYLRTVTSVATLMVVFLMAAMLVPERVQPVLSRFGIERDLPEFMDSLALEAGFYLAALFLICMLCHGELVRIRPGSRHLTLFYLMIAAGGALGGLFVALVCPQDFHVVRGVGHLPDGWRGAGGVRFCCRRGGVASGGGRVGGLRSPVFR